jgi:hypothetical protein
MANNARAAYDFNYNKKRTILKVLAGTNTHISSIDKWKITWRDLLDVKKDTSLVKQHIQNYLNPDSIAEKTPIDRRVQCDPNITVFFNKSINLYQKKCLLHGKEAGCFYISNIVHKTTKYNKLDWLNDVEIMGPVNPITHIGNHLYEVYTDYGILKRMDLDEIERIAGTIVEESIRDCMIYAIGKETACFSEDHFYNLYNGLMITNPYYKIEEFKLPKYKISKKCLIGTQRVSNMETQKRHIIYRILDGSNSLTSTIDRHDVFWKDILAISTNIDKIAPSVKEYLDKRTETGPKRVYAVDVIRQIGVQTALLGSDNEYSKKIRNRRLGRFIERHFSTLNDTRFDKRYELNDIDPHYLTRVAALLRDYEIMKSTEKKEFKKIETKNL